MNAPQSQVCPSCGTLEAAGWYCTVCATPTGPDDWQPDSRKCRPRSVEQAQPRQPDVDATDTADDA